MSAKQTARKVRETYRFIEAHRTGFGVEAMCRVLGVARSGYCAWLREPLCKRAQEDARLPRLIRASFTASHGIYGAPRVVLDLREAGKTCSRHRASRGSCAKPACERCMVIGRGAPRPASRRH